MTAPELPETRGYTAEMAGTFAGYFAQRGWALTPLRLGEKKPAKAKFHDGVGLTAAETEAVLRRGGNIGCLVGRSALVVVDCENWAATSTMIAAGFVPDVVTANAQVAGGEKHGGSHFYFLAPEHLRSGDADLTARTEALPNGGAADVVAGRHMLVLPPSQLAEAMGARYAITAVGIHATGAVPPQLPEFFWRADAAAPAGLEAFSGILSPKQQRERAEVSAESGDLTEAIDAVSWAEWIGGDPRILYRAETDSCGCETADWHRSTSSEKSVTLHDHCGEYGSGAHIWSETMALDLGISTDQSLSRAQLAQALNGTDFRAEVARVGIQLPSEFAESAAYFADVVMLPRGGAVPGPLTAVPAAGAGLPGLGVIEAEVIEGELVEEGSDVEARARKAFRELRPAIAEIERQLRGERDPKTGLWQGMTPALGRIANQAESSGVYAHGLTGALLPRAVAGVPPYVLLPPRNGLREHKAAGQGLNCYTTVLAPSSAGKGETDSAAEIAIPLPEGVAGLLNGTAEYWSKALRGVHDGEEYIKTTSAFIAIDEIVAFNAELTRSGTKLPGWLASTWMNGVGGQGTSDEKNTARLPRHGSRIGIVVNAQPANMRVLGDLNATGVGPRFAKALAGVIAKAERGPLYGLPVPPVMADQTLLPWYTRGHVGEPPITAQQSPEWLAANAGVAPKFADMTGEGLERRGVEGFDDAPPFWIDLPDAALRDIEDGVEVAAARAADWGLAFDQDQDGSASGHRVVLQQHVAAALAIMDAQTAITEAQWHAAGLFLAGSDLIAQAVNAYLEMTGEAEEANAGHLRGVGYAASKASEVGVTTRNVQSAMRAIITRLQAAGGSAKPGYLKAGIKGRFSGMSPTQKRHAEQAFAVLERAGQVRLGLDGTWILDGTLAITQKPAA